MSTCANRIVCPGSDSPYANVSSEAPDPFLFIGKSYCDFRFVGGLPKLYFSDVSQEDADLNAAAMCPVGPVGFSAPAGAIGPAPAYPCVEGCGTIDQPLDPPSFVNVDQTCEACCDSGPCVSYTMSKEKIQGRSQEEADLWAKTFACRAAAQLALLQCPGATCITIDGVTICRPDELVPPYNPPPAIAIFWNGPQSCEAECPDGTISVYTVLPGRFSGRTQAQADAAAQSYACRQAFRQRFCVTSLEGHVCLGHTATFLISAFGGSGSVTWAFSSGALPDGMTAAVSGRSVTVSGTGTVPGLFTFALSATDSLGHSVTKSFTIAVLGIVEGFSLPSASNAVFYSTTITAAGGTAPYQFALLSGALPTGLTIALNGTISGTPIEPITANFPFTAAVKDATGAICIKDLNIFVQGGCIIADASPLTAFDQGQPYSHQLTTSGGVGPFTWVKTAGVFPTGINMSASGLISGTPTLVNGNQDTTFTVRVTDSILTTCEATFLLPIMDYRQFPTGKKWRIQGYVDGLFTNDSGCLMPAGISPVWDGTFQHAGSNIFCASFDPAVAFPFNRSVSGFEMSIQLTACNDAIYPTNEWRIYITDTGTPTKNLWVGRKVGSNATSSTVGSKFDSPAGTYTLLTGELGENQVCSAVASVVLEEF